MTEFERITESTETLAAFLASLPCIEGPWNEAFHERFCNYCPAKDCDNCQYEEYRNNPLWWLKLRDEPSEGTKQAAKKLAALVEEYSALEAGKVLDISLNAAKILNEEKDIDWAMAISAAQSLKIFERDGQEPETAVIDLDPAEAERPLTAEEEKTLQKVKPLFRYAIESGSEPGAITIMPMGENAGITLHGEADIQHFINRLLDLRRNA